MHAGGGRGNGEPIVPPLPLKRQRSRFTDVTVTIVLPWLVFFLVLSMFLFAYHDMKLLVWILLGACLALALLFLSIGCAVRSGTFLAIGYLCLTSLLVGGTVGFWLDREYLQRYWELDEGNEYKDVDPMSDARETREAAVLHFASDTFVDDRRTIGFVAEGGIFCVAPVALPVHANASVEYWAVGQDCCEMRSNFDCGTARDLGAITAVAERPNDLYTKAIYEAASVYSLNSSAYSKLVSFVNDPQVVIGDIWDEALTIALVAMMMDLCMCTAAGLVLTKILVPLLPEEQPLLSHG